MAKKTTLKKLKINALRGSTKLLEVEFHKPLTLIYGENGTGKSTICDALDLLGNKKVGSVEKRGLGATDSYWTSVGKNKTDILVELETKSNNWKATVNGKNVNVMPQNDIPSVSVLRRSQILNLIQANPAERFTEIKKFIDIAKIEQSENELRRLIKSLDEEQNQASFRIDENRASIESYSQRLGNDKEDIFTWSRNVIQIDFADFDIEISHLKVLEQTLNTLKQEQQSYEKAKQSLINTQTESEEEQQIVDKVLQNTLPNTQEILKILQAASQHFNSHPIVDKCPLCDSSEFSNDLPNRVSQKISQLNTLHQAISNKEKTNHKLQLNKNTTELEKSKLEKSIITLTQKIEECLVFPSLERDTISILQQQITQNIDAIQPRILHDSISKLIGNINQRIDEISKYKGEINGLKSAIKQYDCNIENQKSTSVLLPVLNKVLQLHETKRKQFVDNILSQIADEVGRLYELLHPSEGLNKIALMLDPKKRASLEIETNFYSLTNAPPAAYFSDSHLDTLGLCVFIAIAALDDLENTILVLDDVLGSIDEPHVDRLVETLYDETQRFMHCIITTHYRPWREKFRLGQLRNGQCQLIELGKWSHSNGVIIGAKGKPPVDELKDAIEANPQSLQLICSSAGVLLEQMCDFLTEKYECSMPRKKHGYTLDELLTAISSSGKGKLQNALRAEIKQDDGSYLDHPLKDRIEEIKNLVKIRNIVGCHYNQLALHLPPQDAQRFGQLVLEMAEIIICPVEGLPSSDKSGSYWSTKNETRRLHPLKKPS